MRAARHSRRSLNPSYHVGDTVSTACPLPTPNAQGDLQAPVGRKAGRGQTLKRRLGPRNPRAPGAGLESPLEASRRKAGGQGACPALPQEPAEDSAVPSSWEGGGPGCSPGRPSEGCVPLPWTTTPVQPPALLSAAPAWCAGSAPGSLCAAHTVPTGHRLSLEGRSVGLMEGRARMTEEQGPQQRGASGWCWTCVAHWGVRGDRRRTVCVGGEEPPAPTLSPESVLSSPKCTRSAPTSCPGK